MRMQQENETQFTGSRNDKKPLTNLKELCTSTPIQAYADFAYTHEWFGSGAVLYQEQDRDEKVISYTS